MSSGWHRVTLNLGRNPQEATQTNRYEIYPGELDLQTCTPLKEAERTLLDLFDTTLNHAAQDPAEIWERMKGKKEIVSIQDEIDNADDEGEEEQVSREDLDRLNQINQNILSQLIEDKAQIEQLWETHLPKLNQGSRTIETAMRAQKQKCEISIARYGADLQIIH